VNWWRLPRWEWLSLSGIAALSVLLAVAGWYAWEPRKPEPPRAREFRDYDVCLLTDSQGIAVEPARTAWRGLQTVLERTSVRVSYVPVNGEQTTATARQLLASAVQQRCGIILAIGDAQTAAVAAERDRYPQVKFVVLTGSESAGDVTAKVLPLVPPRGK
jgi:hypothetical protein